MPNHNSHAGHVPERSCVICKKKVDRSSLLKFVILGEQIIFNINGQMTGRGYYAQNKTTDVWSILING